MQPTRFNPDKLFIVLSEIDVKQHLSLIQTIKKIVTDLPVIVATEEADRKDILTLLRAGMNETIGSLIAQSVYEGIDTNSNKGGAL